MHELTNDVQLTPERKSSNTKLKLSYNIIFRLFTTLNEMRPAFLLGYIVGCARTCPQVKVKKL